jgi:hypothetical protein
VCRYAHTNGGRPALYPEPASTVLTDPEEIERYGDLLCTVMFLALMVRVSWWACRAIGLASMGAGAWTCGHSPFTNKSYGVNASVLPHADADVGWTVLTWFTLGKAPPGNEFVLTTLNIYLRRGQRRGRR